MLNNITCSPNDFNIRAIIDFMNNGIFKIPQFQRNFVWDLERASKLIESLIIGLPIPQVFLWEKSRNSYLIVDGQQRLMSIYYFTKMRFPNILEKYHIRKIYDEYGYIPENILSNDEYFTDFNLKLNSQYNGQNYKTLSDRLSLELRPLRCMVIKSDDDNMLFEIFERLNAGGINMSPMEVRILLYNSDFIKMILKYNDDSRWRNIVGFCATDNDRINDVELIIKGFAWLILGDQYTQNDKCINDFLKVMMSISQEELALLDKIMDNFLKKYSDFRSPFHTLEIRDEMGFYESVFSQACSTGYLNKSGLVKNLDEIFSSE